LTIVGFSCRDFCGLVHALDPRGFAVAVALTAVLVAGCAGARSPTDAQAEGTETSSAYGDSIYRSAVFEPSSVHPLLVVPAGAEKVSVVTWTGRQTAEKFYPLGEASVGVDVWVTLAPQVRRLCETFPSAPDALRLRLQQLLGLPAKDEERVFVEMQARARDIFRPCPDPDPTKAECGNAFPKNVDVAHKAWLAEQVLERYQAAPQGYPWTRLGYTYDWNPASPRYGASEYVVRKGSKVTVTEKQPTAVYCRPPQS
jgi:hypothetical protein